VYDSAVAEPSVLIVANPYESAMIRRAVESAGARAREAEAEEAVVVMREIAPEVVVLASVMSHADGLALAGRLRDARGGGSRPRLILLGGEGTPVRTLADARQHGADDFLTRPVDLKALVGMVLGEAGPAPGGRAGLAGVGAVVAAKLDAALEGALDSALSAVSPPLAAAPRLAPLEPERGAPDPKIAPLPRPAEPRAAAPRPVPEPPAPPWFLAPPPEPARPPAPALSAAAIEERRERIRQVLRLWEEGDYFALLGVGRDASGADVREAYEKACRDLDPALAGVLGADFEQSLATVKLAIEEAFRVLRRDEVRAAYRTHLIPA
jgi:CheY-like chemotaxis protein